MNILGEEVNEKITSFDELLNTPVEDIPKVDDVPLYNISEVSLEEKLEYDKQIIESGTKVKMIELDGLPFVTFGHVLNAYGSGGKLSDFNHPRIIGRTHLCLSAIDDNYYSLVVRYDVSIDYVQLLFSELPSESLVIASERDIGSRTENNSLDVNSWRSGKYNSIRRTISKTYHDFNGYNEYVYYRQGLMPSAVLIRGVEPTKSEIEAAAYLSRINGREIPLVKINKSKYPQRTDDEMIERDKELQETYYKEKYQKARKRQLRIDIDKLRQLKNSIINLKQESDELETQIGKVI